MSSVDSDGAAEMLEGGIRAASTGALRMVETMQRRQQWAARHQASQLRHDTRRVEQQQRALTAVDGVVRGGPRTGIRATPTTVAAHDPQAALPAAPTARHLFPHFAPDVAEAAMNDLLVHGDLPAYLHAYRAASEEAGQTGRAPDAAELHRRAVELFTDTHHETAAAHHEQAQAQGLDQLRQLLSADDSLAVTTDVAETDDSGSDLEPIDLATADGYDTAAARERRADAVRAQGYDADTTASALLHDLSFGVPASAATGPAQPATGPNGVRNRARSHSHTQQLTR